MKLRKWDEQHCDILREWLNRRPTMLSESSVAYHVIWKEHYQTKFHISDKGILWVQRGDYGEPAALLPVTTLDNMRQQFDQLQAYFSEELRAPMRMYMVDEDALGALKLPEDKYDIVDDTEDCGDYIYDAKDMRTLAGSKFHKKRTLINNFLREYEGRYRYCPMGPEDKDKICAFMGRWMEDKQREDPLSLLQAERDGILRLMDVMDESGVRVSGIEIDGKLKAFAMGSYSERLKSVIIHEEKADIHIKGMYAFMDQQFLIREFPDALYVNREEDMGIPSLRTAKELYHPLYKTKKYRVVEKQGRLW